MLAFATTQDEAHMRADAHEKKDPFPSIPTALLSSAEILDYVRVTGMIHPFDKEHLKSASYEACARGAFFYWEDKRKKVSQNVDDNLPYVTLPGNSISFLQLQPKFRLPYYIGARFNLSINHVHRGLLLGTGPLVDPGFRGQLLIPLHNLTATPYELRLDEALVCIEFTKTSFGINPAEQEASPQRVFVPFPPHKRNLTPDDYVRRANADEPIVGAMPDAIREAKDQVKEAKRQAEQAKHQVDAVARSVRNLTVGGAAVVIIGVAGAVYGGYQIVEGSLSLITSVQHALPRQGESMQERNLGPTRSGLVAFSNQQDELKRIHGEIDNLNARLRVLEFKAGDPAAEHSKHVPQ
ncbi:MAG: hypothetical protein KGL56_00085 [Alphaproteobacteria bacterium]|nr:hypothetical protein [Alphaproteobacteria bacterium]